MSISALLPATLDDPDGPVPVGPGWLQERRRAAAGAAAGMAMPSTDEEVWRYSRIAEVDLDRYTVPTGGPEPTVPAALSAVIDAVPDRSALVVTIDGILVRCDLDPALAGRGVRLGGLAGDEPGGVAEVAEAILGAVVAERLSGLASGFGPGLFVTLNDALSAPVILDVPPGVVVPAPVLVIDWVSRTGLATFPRLAVRAGADSEVAVVEWHGSAPVDALVVPVTELDAGPSARLRHTLVQHRGPDVWQIGELAARAGASATVRSTQLALGGRYARCRADCRLSGRGATGHLDAAYFGAGEQMLDFRTFQDHAAPDTTSNLLFKGAVGDHSQSVYTGLIRVEKEARGTNAFQTNRNIKLSDHAWAESVPNLEIENNDVRCSHASTVGPIDADQRFYLESRGVPPEAAERLIVNGFFDEVLSRVGVPGVEAAVRTEIDRRLTTVVKDGTTDDR